MDLEGGYFLKHVQKLQHTAVMLLVFDSFYMQNDFSVPVSTILHAEMVCHGICGI